MITATSTLARRIEQAEAGLIAGMGKAVAGRLGASRVIVAHLGSGTAVMPGPGSPLSKVAGLGFEPIDEHALTKIEQDFASFGTPVRVELSSLADPAVGKVLSGRGYVLSGFENVLGLTLPPPVLRTAPSGSDVHIAPTTSDDFEEWVAAVTTGFMHPDTFDGPPPIEPPDTSGADLIFRDMATLDGFSRYVARRQGEVAGGASMRIENGVAQLCGAATLPAHRRVGIQSALLAKRLTRAADAGCDIAVITTEPGSKSQRNAQRQGFELLYVRAVMIKGS